MHGDVQSTRKQRKEMELSEARGPSRLNGQTLQGVFCSFFLPSQLSPQFKDEKCLLELTCPDSFCVWVLMFLHFKISHYTVELDSLKNVNGIQKKNIAQNQNRKMKQETPKTSIPIKDHGCLYLPSLNMVGKAAGSPTSISTQAITTAFLFPPAFERGT